MNKLFNPISGESGALHEPLKWWTHVQIIAKKMQKTVGGIGEADVLIDFPAYSSISIQINSQKMTPQ